MKDLGQYLRVLRRAGYSVELSHGNHYRITKGDEMVTVARSSSRSPASLRDLRAHMKRFERQQDAA